MKALFVCNVTKTGGAGHLIRSIAIAEHAKARGMDVLFLGKFETPFARSALTNGGFSFKEFSGDSNALASLAARHGATIVHCDDYSPRPRLHEALSEREIPLSTVEDGVFGSRSADLIIDPSPQAEHIYREKGTASTHLRGLPFVPLRNAISRAAAVRRAAEVQLGPRKNERFTVLIVLGGTDAAGATHRLVELWTMGATNSICFAILPGESHARVENRYSSEIHWLPTTPDLADLLAKVDAVVIAAGTTVWEVCAVRIAAAVIQQADNQSTNYRFAVDSGSMLGLGKVEDIDARESKILSQLKQLSAFTLASPAIIDADGADRIVSEWIDCLNAKNSLRIREARMSDASNLFDWRNDSTVRAVSRNSKPLEWAEHIDWLSSVVSSSNRKLLIAVSGWNPVGTVRFEQIPERPEEWEISLALNRSVRGRGLGNELLAESERWLRNHRSGVLHVVAYVKLDNEASIRLFAKNGYRQQAPVDGCQMTRWRKRLEPQK